jgi:hypothetical protein
MMTNTSRLATVSALLLAATLHHGLSAQEIPILSAEVSWIGNTHGGSEGRKPNGDAHGTFHVQMDVDAIWVSPDGKVYANCQADEAHLQGGVYQDGKLVWSINIPWGGGGMAIAGDGQSIYAAQGRGVVRYGLESGRPSGWKALDGKLVTGLTAAGGKLYASDYTDGKIHIFEQEKEVGLIEQPFPGALAVDQNGTIYVAQFEDLWNQPQNRLSTDRHKVLRFSADRQPLRPIVLGEDSRPVALHIDKDGRLLVADNGPEQNIKIYSTGEPPALTAEFGTKFGAYSPPVGIHGPLRFNGLCGIGTDAQGNVYVACNGQGPAREVGNKTWNDTGFTGTVIESYTPQGQRRWVCYGLLFCDVADVDPATDGRDIFSAKQRYVMDYSKPPGQQWTHQGVLINPFKYPADPRVTTENTSKGTAFVRRIHGRRLFFTTGMYAGSLHIFRFNEATDGEVAIPCGRVGRGLWYDANGNGRPDDGETEAGDFGGWGLHIDARGDIWTTAKGISHFPVQGLDANGTPIYKASHQKSEPVPPPFRKIERLIYDAERDVMYLTGNTPELTVKDWGLIGGAIARYDRWSQGNRQAAWVVPVNQQVGLPKAISHAGDYLFVSFHHRGGNVACHVHDIGDGKLIGALVPEGLGGVNKVGDSDVPYAIRAFRRANGEYLVLLEENRNAKNILFRWRPAPATAAEGIK